MFSIPWYISASGGAVIAAITTLFMHNASIDRLNAKHKDAIAAQIRFDIQQCADSNQPAKEANNDSENKTSQLLANCVKQLRDTNANTHVPISSPTSRANPACKQSASGIALSEIIATNIECQKDRNDLNTAKTWGVGYQKYIKGAQ